MHGVYKERIPDEVIPRLAAAGIPEVATLTVFDSYADLYEGRREATALERETVPARILDAFVPVPANGRPAEFETFFALVAAGLTPAQALRAATSDAARFVTGHAEPEFGTIAVGKIADLVLVDGDPTADIGRTAHITHVFLGGTELPRHPIRTDAS